MSLLRPKLKATASTITLCCAAMWLISTLSYNTYANELQLRLQAIEKNLSDRRATQDALGRYAEKTAKELQQIKRHRVDLAKSLFRHSVRADKLDARLKKLQKHELEKSAAMALLQKQMSTSLISVQRLARLPAVILATGPQSPDNTIRSGILLRAIVANLRNEVNELSKKIRDLTKVRVTITEDTKLLSRILADLEEERLALRSLTMKKKTLLTKTQSAEERANRGAARLAREAKNIRDLLKKLKERDDSKVIASKNFSLPPARSPIKSLEGPAPAPGQIVTTFGQRMPNGMFSKGVYIATRPAAPVVAPKNGRVVFAGVFRGYGNLVILELPNLGHALISGMATISAVVGDNIFAGEPLGEMAQSPGSSQQLYFELRKQGHPINPLLPEAASRNKVRG